MLLLDDISVFDNLFKNASKIGNRTELLILLALCMLFDQLSLKQPTTVLR